MASVSCYTFRPTSRPRSAGSASTAGTASNSDRLIPDLVDRWETKLDVTVPKWTIRRMKTKWGSCNRETHHLWFNVELAKSHPDCLEYIVVHEMAHYFERNHGERFTKLLDSQLPDWRTRRPSTQWSSVGS